MSSLTNGTPREILRLSRFSALSSFKHRNFTLFFFGQVISVAGTWMQTVAQSYLVLKITKSGVDLGLLLAIRTAPVMLFATVGGLIVDRFNRINILYLTNTCSGILCAVLAWDVIAGHPTIGFIYLIALGLGIVNTVDNPARQVILSDLVPRDDLTNAVSLNSVMTNGGRILGPAVAGGVIALFGQGTCFALNAASYLVVLLSLFLMRRHELQIIATSQREKGQIRAGVRYVLSRADLVIPLALLFVAGTLVWEFAVTIPLLADDTFHGGATVYGYLFALQGLGAVVGGFITAARPNATNKGLGWAAIGCGLACFLAGLAPTLTFEYIIMIGVGYGVVAFNSIAKSQLQMRASPEMRGRVMAIWTLAWVGTTPIGGPLLGWIGQHFGARWSWYVSGVPLLVLAILVMPALIRLDRKAQHAPNTENTKVIESP